MSYIVQGKRGDTSTHTPANRESNSNPWAGLVLGLALSAGSTALLTPCEPALGQEPVTKTPTKAGPVERRGIKVGDRIPDITVPDRDGKDFTLSSALGERVILVDVWASWCGPCRRENPHVVNAYRRYKDSNFLGKDGSDIGRGFEVVSISVDTENDEWLTAIKSDGLTWPNHGRDNGWSQVGKIYGIKSIPSNFLVDKNGFILAKNLRGRALSNFLEKLRDKNAAGRGF